MNIRVLSGGVAQGLVGGLAPDFQNTTGVKIDPMFGAIGAMKERLLAGVAADVVILSHSMVADLVRDGHLVAGSEVDIGKVHTGLAVRAGDALPSIGDANALRDALRQADVIYFPDPALSTSGIHFAKVMRQLGIVSELFARVRNFPNGHAAMKAMAAQAGSRPIGCTLETEIRSVDGVKFAGLMPHEFDLATTYTAAVARRAVQPDAARQFIEKLASDGAAELRERLGFSTRA